MLALEYLGYTTFHVADLLHAMNIYGLFPNQTIAVLLESNEVETCTKDHTAPVGPRSQITGHCVKTLANPTGIPVWKIFSFFFWVQATHPFGGDWTLSPEDYNWQDPHSTENQYIGYSVQPSCQPNALQDIFSNTPFADQYTEDTVASSPYVPHDDRPLSPPRAYIMSKNLRFFFPSTDYAWSAKTFDAATAETNITFYVGAGTDKSQDPPGMDVEREVLPMLPASIIGGGTGGGQVSQKEFVNRIAHSVALVGVGRPVT